MDAGESPQAESGPGLPGSFTPSERLRQRGETPLPEAPWPPPPAPRPHGAEPLLELLDFSVRKSDTGAPILNTSNVRAFEGETVLLIGMSGAGKSLLMNTIMGFITPETPGLSLKGRIELAGDDLLGERKPGHRKMMGGVFQLQALGLFDDLTTDQNLRFASGGGSDVARRWRERLDLTDAPQIVSRLSGGQRQRVALARALEQGAEVILYDEPTSGLDPRAAAQAVQLIEEHRRRLTLVISHDYRRFIPVADRVLLIDPLSREIGDITSVQDIPTYVEQRTEKAVELGSPEEPRQLTLGRWLKELVVGAAWNLEQAAAAANHYFWLAVAVLVTLPLFLYRAVRDWRIRTQAVRYLLRFLGARAMAFISTAGLLLGVVVTFFVFDRLPLREYTEPLLRPDLLNLLGVIIFRVTGPLITAILVSAKLGANITATVGQMSYSRQVDSLRLFRVPPFLFLFWPIVFGFLVGTIFLTALAIVVSALVSLVFFLHSHPELTPGHWWYHFASHFTWTNTQWVLAKTALSAIGSGIIAYRSGVLPKESNDAIGDAINTTILRSLLWVLMVHGAFAFVEFGAEWGPWTFLWQNLVGPEPPLVP